MLYHTARGADGDCSCRGDTCRPSTTDGSGRVVALTTAGWELIDAAFAEHARNERRLLSALNPEEAAQLESLLATWLARFEHPTVSPPP